MTASPANVGDLRRWLNRATFGVTPALLEEAGRLGWEGWVNEQLAPNDEADAECKKRIQKLRLLIDYEFKPPGTDGAGGEKMMMAGKGARKVKEHRALAYLDQPIEKAFCMYGKDDVPYPEKTRPAEELMMATMMRAVYGRWQVREMLVDFWHNHFNVNSDKDESVALALPAYDRDAIRAHALGNFREMLESIAQSAAMLYYLDGVQSKASPANENFARELFELHTLGARHYLNHLHSKWREVPGALDGKPEGYIDQDVYEAARAFTGWTVENGDDDDGVKRPRTGKFMIQELWHDPYQKRVLASEFDSQRPAIEDGRRVLDLVARHPATAHFIAEKLCRRFVSDTPPEALVAKAVEAFSAGADAPDQIARVVRTILLSPEYAAAPATKLKRPLEYLASYLRAVNADFAPRMDVTYMLENMGQRLFRWTTPTGHPDSNDYWEGGAFLLRRWNMPMSLRDDSWKGIAVCHFLTHTPPECRTIGQALDYWSVRMIGQGAPEKVKPALLQILADSDESNPETEFSGEDKDRDQKLAACAALLAATPEFQYR